MRSLTSGEVEKMPVVGSIGGGVDSAGEHYLMRLVVGLVLSLL
jgi:hypothetical protein